MNKTELIAAMADQAELSKKDAEGQATKIYQEDESYQTASGQFVTFTFTLTDGTEHIVSACAPMW